MFMWCACITVCICTCMCACVCVCVVCVVCVCCMCVHVCACICVSACLSVCVHVCMPKCVLVCMIFWVNIHHHIMYTYVLYVSAKSVTCTYANDQLHNVSLEITQKSTVYTQSTFGHVLWLTSCNTSVCTPLEKITLRSSLSKPSQQRECSAVVEWTTQQEYKASLNCMYVYAPYKYWDIFKTNYCNIKQGLTTEEDSRNNRM